MTTPDAPPRIGPVVAVIVLGAFMAGLDTSLVNVGIATIARELHAPLIDAQWSSSGYLLALAAALPACPFLQHRLGARRVWLGALAVFTLASVACAAAPTLPLLLVARVVQGVGGGVLVPAGQAILGRAAGPARMGRVMSTAGIAVVLAPAIGPAIGGVLLATLSWRALFLVNLPIGLVALVLGLRILPTGGADRSARLDVLGLGLVGVGLPLLSYGLIELGGSSRVVPLALTGAGAALLVAFVLRALRRRTATPLLDLTLFRRPAYAAAQLTVLFTGMSLFGGLILLPLYYEVLRGVDTVGTGLLLLAYGAGAAAALRVGGVLTDRLGGGISTTIGLLVSIVATVPFIVLPADADLVLVEALQLLRGIGVGLAGLPAMSSAYRAASDALADATTTANILQRVGGSLGSATLVLLLGAAAGVAAFHLAFAALAVTALIALVPALALVRAQRRSTTAPMRVSSP